MTLAQRLPHTLWINPTAWRVLVHSDGKGEQERERQRDRVAGNGCNQMAAGPVRLRYGHIATAYRPDIKRVLRGLVDRTLCCYSFGPESKLLLLLLCGQCKSEQRLVERFLIPLTFDGRPADT